MEHSLLVLTALIDEQHPVVLVDAVHPLQLDIPSNRSYALWGSVSYSDRRPVSFVERHLLATTDDNRYMISLDHGNRYMISDRPTKE